MVPANKILTVAYGTFSCTLEGFDDPFSTMTEIAEYFRGLAAEDRYFGAEPPTPDMAMLRQIAEANAKRSVEAHEDDSGVTLRPALVAAAPVAEVPATEESPATEDAVESPEPATVDEDPVEAPVVEDAEPEVTEIVAEDADSAAAKLARLRDAVAEENAAEAADTADSYSEDQHADEAPATTGEDSLAAAFSDTEEDTGEGTGEPEEVIETAEDTDATEASEDDDLDAELAALLGTDTLLPEAVEDEAPEVTPEAEASEQPAAELDAPVADAETPQPARPRIRVRKVRRADATAATEATQTDETPAPGAPAPTEHAASEPVAEADDNDLDVAALEAALAAEDQTSQDGADPSGDDVEDSLMAELAAIEAELSNNSPAPAETAPTAEAEDDADADLLAELAAIRAGEVEEQPERAYDDEEYDLEAVLAEAADSAHAVEAPTEDRPSSEEEAVAAPDSEEEVAAGEAAASDEADVTDDGEKEDPTDLERLFAATNSRLSGEDTSRRHANISHLKAAVAARRADSSLQDDTSTGADTNAYREDLSRTVRPRRAAAPTETRSARPERVERPAPLVLVSEQRVTGAPEAETPEPVAVTPRRAPRMADLDATETSADSGPQRPEIGDDFEQFAQDVGATDLADILEAAAVYSATVMGQENFSRPRLLHLAAEAAEDMSREDGLRGFGQLLRDGTLRKVSRGTFALGTDSRFRSEAERRVG